MKTDTPAILLVQARCAGDESARHELECFAARCQIPESAFTSLNLATDPVSSVELLDHDMVMVGGAGDFSLVKGGFDWHEDLLELMRDVVRRQMPMFASCFGFQAIVQAFGGRVESVDAMAELGTHRVYLTEAGKADPLFGEHPDEFDAQFGHNDSATRVPEELTVLAESERCPHQAVRYRDLPIVATQFHPELSWRDNARRYMTYLRHYGGEGITAEEAERRALEMHRPSPDANALLVQFMKHIMTMAS
ncbi:MAG: type 1 glutamine amidotransferase [Myxococcota bacterium]